MANPVRKPRTRAHFATEIATQWQRSREAIFAVGRLLISAKQQLEHGEFTAMVENDLPFSSRTAQRLMAIARDKRLTNTTHVSLLPVSWGTLYELTLLSADDFDVAIADGSITPDMTRGDAVSLVEQYERDRQDAAADNDSTEQTDRFERPSPTHEMLSPGAVATIGGSRRSRASRAAPGDEPSHGRRFTPPRSRVPRKCRPDHQGAVGAGGGTPMQHAGGCE